MVNKRKRKGQNPKLAPKFVGPYTIVEVWPNHTYIITRNGQESLQNESRLKRFLECPEQVGQAPFIAEGKRLPIMKGSRRQMRETLEAQPDLPFDPLLQTIRTWYFSRA